MFYRIESDQLIFNSCELRSLGVVISRTDNLGLLVTAPSTSLYGIEKSYNFLHKTVQEFCAAWYISKILSPQDQQECINTNWDSDRYYMVWMFYSGITGLMNTELLNCVLPCMLVKSSQRISDLLEYVFEAQNTKVCQIVGDHLSENINIDPEHFGEGLMTCVIDYFLTHYKGSVKQITIIKKFDVDLHTLCELENLKQLLLHKNIKLIIGPNLIARANFQPLISFLRTQFPVNELHLKFSVLGLVELDFHFLTEIFTTSNTLRVLDISRATINSKLAAYLAALRNVRLFSLRMECCHLGPTGADKIGEMLYYNHSIASVDLSLNNIGDDGVERLVYHLHHNSQLQHLNLSSNNITVVGAGLLRRLISTDHPTLTSIELSRNRLRDEGVHVILSSLTATMEHIGVRRVNMTSSSSQIIAATLHKVKSIGFDQLDDYEGICDGLANSTVLKKLELGIVSDSVNQNYFSAIGRNDSIVQLHIDDVTDERLTNIVKLLEKTRTPEMKLWNPSQFSPLLLLADSLTANKSVKILKYYDGQVKHATILKFLKQLKQVCTIEELTLAVSFSNDYQFIHSVESIVQQIAHNRSSKGVSSLLKVNIASYYSTMNTRHA